VVVGLSPEVEELDLDAAGLVVEEGAGDPEGVLLKLGVASEFHILDLYAGNDA